MPVKVPWTRLIRFIAEEDEALHYGDAIVPNEKFDIGLPENLESLKAKVIAGNPLDPGCTLTDRVLSVKKLLGPLTKETVPAVRCIGGNYKTHLAELGMEPPRFPIMFTKFPDSVTGYGDDIEIPKIAQDDQADYEGELTIVIGKDAKNVTEEDAWDYIIGYTVANDVSARKWQMDPELVGKTPQISFSKSFDTYCPMGPCIIAAHYLKDPEHQSLQTSVNGELRQQIDSLLLVHNIPQIIHFVSQGTTLRAGSVILTGTPSGIGYMMKPPQFLCHGDKVEITIGKIGTLVNRVVHV